MNDPVVRSLVGVAQQAVSAHNMKERNWSAAAMPSKTKWSGVLKAALQHVKTSERSDLNVDLTTRLNDCVSALGRSSRGNPLLKALNGKMRDWNKNVRPHKTTPH
jgi:hypothetical protein